jgi:hypothetical protein
MTAPLARRFGLACLALGAVAAASSARAQPSSAGSLVLATAGSGSAFLAFGKAVAPVIGKHANLAVEIRETKGSNENAVLVSRGEVPFATLNMGPGFDAWHGRGPFAGDGLRGMRAVVPMYETPFHAAALKRSRIASLRDLDGKRVGVGPANGPGEVFFKGLADALGIRATVVTGTPDELADKVASGEIDAFWYGSGLPSPPFRKLAEGGEAVIFGFKPDEAEAFRKAFAYFAPYEIKAETYEGQRDPLQSLAVWNFLVAHEGVSADIVHAVAKALLDDRAEVTAAFPAASAMTAQNVSANTFMPFHPGAVRYYREAGVTLPAGLAGN